jgi:beta-lactamase class A
VSELFAVARDELRSFPGEASAFVCDADGRELFCERADEPFPSASVIKLPLVMALYADAAGGRIDLEERLPVGERIDGTGVLRHLRDVETMSVRDLAVLAIIVSDNTATNRLIERFGVDRVNERMREWGCARSVLARKMFDFEAAKRGHENVMTARETAALLVRLVRGECEDRATSDAVLALLAQCQDRTMLRRYLPYGAKVAHKTGTLDESRNDAAIISGEPTIVVAASTRRLRDNEAAVSWLGVLGWCAYRAAGHEGAPLPPELVRTA